MSDGPYYLAGVTDLPTRLKRRLAYKVRSDRPLSPQEELRATRHLEQVKREVRAARDIANAYREELIEPEPPILPS